MQPPLVVVGRHFQLNLVLELTFFSHFKVFFCGQRHQGWPQVHFAFELICNPYFYRKTMNHEIYR